MDACAVLPLESPKETRGRRPTGESKWQIREAGELLGFRALERQRSSRAVQKHLAESTTLLSMLQQKKFVLGNKGEWIKSQRGLIWWAPGFVSQDFMRFSIKLVLVLIVVTRLVRLLILFGRQFIGQAKRKREAAQFFTYQARLMRRPCVVLSNLAMGSRCQDWHSSKGWLVLQREIWAIKCYQVHKVWATRNCVKSSLQTAFRHRRISRHTA